VDARNNYSIFYLIISLFFAVWLCVDFFNTISTGETLMMRVDGKISFQQAPFLFVFTIVVKIVVMVFSLFYIFNGITICYQQCFKQRVQKAAKSNQKNKVNKPLKKKRGY